jgi:hypothetical protein
LIETYRARLARFEEARVHQEGLGVRLGWARVGVFVAGFALYVAADVTGGVAGRWWGVGALAALGLFLLLVVWHRSARAHERQLAALARSNREAVARVERDWGTLPAALQEDAEPHHPYAADLDLSGEASLFRLLSTVTLPPGVDTLRRWLLSPAGPGEVLKRQVAVEELASLLDFRQALEAKGRLADPPSPASLRSFLAWAEGEPWLPKRPWLRLAAWSLPLLTGVLVALQVTGLVRGPWWLLSMVVALAVGGSFRREIHPLMDAAGSGQEGLYRYAAVLSLFLETEVRSSVLEGLKDAVRSGTVGPERELRRLGRITAWADVRHSAMAHGPLQALLVWDVHVLAGLEGWKARWGRHVRRWLEALGELEALAALGALKADNPEWVFPSLADGGEPGLRALDLGHPLIPPERCVGNDVEMGPPGSFVFLTGSNMSGKSTLLRAVGLNAVLAQAGGPVCARRMEMTPLDVQTSMRATDSLARGVSQYMAELQRIRQVVEAARGGGSRGGGGAPGLQGGEEQSGAGGGLSGGDATTTTLYLLDEPLQGTNEAERRVAVQTILGHLLDAGAVGMVATHDLQLDHSEVLGPAARAAHFEGVVREDGKGPILSFDYRLRAGRATSTNALALLRAVGLGAGEVAES